MKVKRILSLLLCAALSLPLFSACAKNGVPATISGENISPHTFLIDTPSPGYTFTAENYKAERQGSTPTALSAAIIKPEGDVPDHAIFTDTAFILTAAGKTNEDEIKQFVSISPSIDFAVKKQSDLTYKLIPEKPLDDGRVYKIIIGGEGQSPVLSYAFQTLTEFKLKSTLPADLAVEVPVNTGIELSFSEPVGEQSLSGALQIEPAVNFDARLYPDGKTAVFIPKDYLAENTIYTVTVSGEINSLSGKALGADISFKFRTEAISTVTSEGRVYINPESLDLTFSTGQTPVFKWQVYTHSGQKIKENDAKVKIWRYPSVSALAEAVKKMNETRADLYFSGKEYKYPTDNLVQTAAYSTKITALKTNQYSRQNYIELKTEGLGIYLCEIEITVNISGESVIKTYQAIVQITDLRLYTEAFGDSLLLWAQGTSGLDASGADIAAELYKASGDFRWNVDPDETVYTSASGKANADGLCYLDTGEADNAYIIVRKEDDALFRSSALYSYEFGKSYFATVFFDREVYFSSDIINFRGYLRPAYDGGLPENVVLKTSLGTKINLCVAADGSFMGSYTLEEFFGWGISFNFADGDGNTIINRYIRVTQEEKPVYTASLAFDRPAYNYGEDAAITLTAAFFDGTPAPGLKFELYFNYFKTGPVTLVTDAQGKAVYTLKTGDVTAYSTYPIMLNCSAQLTGYEGTSLYLSIGTLYFHSDVFFSYEHVSSADGDRHILITLDRFDFKKIASLTNSDEIYGEDYPKNLFAGYADGKVSVTLAESWYDEIEKGTSYDPINKTTSKIYRYEKREQTLDSFSAEFAQGKLKLSYANANANANANQNLDRWRFYTVKYKDTRGKNIFSFTINAKDSSDRYAFYTPEYNYYELDFDRQPKSVGDNIKFNLMYGNKPVIGGRMLYTVYTDKRNIAAVTESNEFSIEYKAEYIKGMQLYIVYFDGVDFAYTGEAGLSYDYASNSSLHIEITPDNEVYKPGDKATVTVSVTDSFTGKPLNRGNVTLAVVDEACFALGEQYLDPAAEFYGSRKIIPYVSRNRIMPLFPQSYLLYGGYGIDGSIAETASPIKDMNASFEAPVTANENDGARVQTNGSVTIRKTFLNNPLFITLNAEDNGTAVFTFIVPDNITEWRFTAVAESEESDKPGGVKLGGGLSSAISTLPFFINTYVNSSYIAGDEVTASVRVYGSSLEAGAQTEFTAVLADNTGNKLKSLTESAPAGSQVFFSFGKLGEGSYGLTVTALCGNYTDGVLLPFKVVETGVLTPVRRELKPGLIGSLKPSSYPVTLTFYSSAYEDWIKTAEHVMHQRSLRADSLAAYYVTGKAIASALGSGRFFEAQLKEAKSELSSYGDTLIPLLPYSLADIELTALILTAAPEALSKSRRETLLSELRLAANSATDDALDFAALYMGLAAAGEPVLAELRFIAEHSALMPIKAQLYICAGLAAIGDYSLAQIFYNQLREKYAEFGEDGTMWFAAPGATAEERISGAASALLAAAIVSPGDADALASYIKTRTSSLELYVLQLAFYVKAFIPKEGSELKLLYKTSDGEQNEKITPFERVYLTLDKSGFNSFEVISADEGISVCVSYMGTLDEAQRDEKPTEEASLVKTVTVYDAARGLYKVTLDYKIKTDRDYSYFAVTDLIPSGGRHFYIEQKSLHSNNGYAYLYNDGQTMRGGIYINNVVKAEDSLKGRQTKTVTGSVSYMFRVAIPGEYISESAFMQNLSSGCYAVSGKTNIILK